MIVDCDYFDNCLHTYILSTRMPINMAPRRLNALNLDRKHKVVFKLQAFTSPDISTIRNREQNFHIPDIYVAFRGIQIVRPSLFWVWVNRGTIY